jgi:hypothetical protein
MILFGDIAPGWRALKPLVLTVERDESGDFVVSDTTTSVYGEGSNPSEAYADYVSSLIDYLVMLEKDASHHAPTKKLFSYLRTYIARR